MGNIELKNLKFWAQHGVSPLEQKTGNFFLVSVVLTCDLERASISDQLEDTINYVKVYELIEQEMKIPSKLLEHVAERIKCKIHSHFSQVSHIRIKITKLNAPVKGLSHVSVEL